MLNVKTNQFAAKLNNLTLKFLLLKVLNFQMI